ncbi:MAG: 4-hydroxy-tetrahydrodipicolinate reductase [Actinomycetota bacterium]|nr:4-hydroxy-tetrahydrodipicolinate reductase [Actinomycetota bacterium]
MIRVGVIGAAGKMGREVCRAVLADPDLHLVAAVEVRDNGTVGEVVGSDNLGTKIKMSDELETLTDAEVDVAVDFTHPSAVMQNIRWCVRHAVHAVVGTTGITQENLDEIAALIEEEGGESSVFIAPNFATGAVLMMKFAATAARYLPSVEIIELHHDQKADAPSGTAAKSAHEIAAARAEAAPVAGGDASFRGGDVEGIRIHSVRISGLVAHQEVLLGSPGQLLTIRHDSFDRASFMPGVLLAIKEVAKRPGVTYGLEHLLDL